MVKRSTVSQFVRSNGYDILKKREDGNWKNISLASKKTGLSRQTIYNILAEFPQPPSKTKPKYVEEFERSEGYRRLKEKCEKTLGYSSYRHTVKDVVQAWKFLNKKDPISWNEDDFRKIWNWKRFHSLPAEGFEEYHATSFRRLMRVIERHDLLAKFKGKKRPAGLKTLWFLRDEEIIRLIDCIEDIEVLIFLYRGIVEGARVSALLETRVKKIDFHDYIIQVFESKTGQVVLKYPPIIVFKLLERYIRDFNLKPEDRLFSKGYDYFNKALRKAGRCANLGKTVTTHILKHTFVSQAHRHGVSAETVVKQTGTELKTLVKYYRAKDEKRIRHELQGIEYHPIPFYEWVKNLHSHFVSRYEKLWKKCANAKNLKTKSVHDNFPRDRTQDDPARA